MMFSYSRRYLLMMLFSMPLLANSPQYWDWQNYAQNALLQAGWAQRFFLDQYPFMGTETVLDIGSGDGKTTAKIARKVTKGSVVGIDKSSSMVTNANLTFLEQPNLKFVKQDAQSADFYNRRPSMFDLVTSFVVLHWVPDQLTVLKGIHTVLKPGGKTYLRLSSNGGDPIQELSDLLRKSPKWQSEFAQFKDPMRRYSPEEYRELVQKSGLRLIKITDVEDRDPLKDTEQLRKQLKSWLPHYHFLREKNSTLAEPFLEEVIRSYLAIFPPNKDGSLVLYDHYLEVVAEKNVRHEQSSALG